MLLFTSKVSTISCYSWIPAFNEFVLGNLFRYVLGPLLHFTNVWCQLGWALIVSIILVRIFVFDSGSLELKCFFVVVTLLDLLLNFNCPFGVCIEDNIVGCIH